MKKSSKGEAVLSGFQIQATRLNKLEYRRFQQNVNIMNDDLKIQLNQLHRRTHDIRHHYANVVRMLKPDPKYKLWKQIHAYELAQHENQYCLDLMKLKQKSRTRTHEHDSSSDEAQSESMPPLLVLLGTDRQKPVQPIIDFNTDILRPGTSPVQKSLSADSPRKTPLWKIVNERPVKSRDSFRSNQLVRNATSLLPTITSPDARRFEQSKSAVSAAQKTANIDALYRIALQNQTADKSNEQAHIEKRKLFDKQFATQNRALSGTNRISGLVK